MINPFDVDEALDQALPIPSEKLAPGAEAPASATVHAWDVDNFGVLFTIRDTDAKNLYARVGGLIQTLKRDGWKPDWKSEGVSTPPQTQKAVVGQPMTSQQGSDDAPMCNVHNVPMTYKSGTSKKTGRAYAFWGCSMKNQDGSYCNSKI